MKAGTDKKFTINNGWLHLHTLINNLIYLQQWRLLLHLPYPLVSSMYVQEQDNRLTVTDGLFFLLTADLSMHPST